MTTPISESYAEALMNAATELDLVEDVADELDMFEAIYDECHAYLDSPLVGSVEKIAMLRGLLTYHFNYLTLEFVILMLTRKHLRHLHATAERFRHLCGRAQHTVTLRLPFEPRQPLAELIRQHLVAKGMIAEDHIEFRMEVDESLLGGFVAYCNGVQIDASLKTALGKLITRSQLHDE